VRSRARVPAQVEEAAAAARGAGATAAQTELTAALEAKARCTESAAALLLASQDRFAHRRCHGSTHSRIPLRCC
jgi:hypothetical protein